MALESFVRYVESFGLVDVLLPFLLIFIFLYAILSKSKLLGKMNAINLGFSIVVSLVVITIHVTNRYPGAWDPVIIINNAIGDIALLIIGLIALFLVLGVIGISHTDVGKTQNDFFSVLLLVLINVFVYFTYPYIFKLTVYVSIFVYLVGAVVA